VPKKRHLPRKNDRRRAIIEELEQITKPWRLAIFKLREQLEEDCLSHSAERRRFQNRRLIENFIAELRPSRVAALSAEMSYWLFCGSPWQDQLGYEDARQQHYAELKAFGFSPEFQPSESQLKHNAKSVLTELVFRLDSLACWIEAQESWMFWKMLNREPAAWDREDAQARRQASDAGLIARLPTVTDRISDWLIAGIVESFRTWTKPQWVKILKMAVRLAERGEQPVTELDTWVWWRYPVFSRYYWSAAEVCRAARKRFGEIDQVKNEAAFQSAWVRRGLRFTGKRTRRKCPLLWDFVINEKVPTNVPSGYPLLTAIPYENSSSQA
jgi:hypothetical protein